LEENDPRVDVEIRMGIGAAEAMGKRLLFPDRHRFNELFLSWTVIRDLSPGKYKSRRIHTWNFIDGPGSCHLTSFCSVRGEGIMLDVQPCKELIDAVGENMLLSADYNFNFAIATRDNGTALLYVQYDRILGDRWIAILATSSIPGINEAKEEDEEEDEYKTEYYESKDDEPPLLHPFPPRT
jgi:hypothetical protein